MLVVIGSGNPYLDVQVQKDHYAQTLVVSGGG